MRPVASPLAARLATGSSKTAWCYRITTKTGTVYRYTEGDVAATFSGDGTYERYAGLLGGSISYGLDGRASGVDIQFGVTDATPITRDNIRDGLFDAAEVDIWEYDQGGPADGRVQVFWGRVGDIVRRAEGGVKLSADGILAQSHEIVIDRYIPTCIWFFCDERCGLNAGDFTFAAAVVGISPDRYTVTISGAAAAQPADIFKDGVMSVTSGARVGVNIALRGNSGATLLSHLAVPAAMQVGDTLSVLQGCSKLWDSTSEPTSCTHYNNRLRFGGQPFAGSAQEAQNITYSDWS